MKMIQLICILAFTLVSGCSSSGFVGLNSYVAKEYPVNAETVVVQDMSNALVDIYPPGYTAIHVKMSKNQKDNLGEAFENALRTRGFSVVPEQFEDTLAVSYVLDSLDETTWYSRLALSNGTVLTRTWRLVGENMVAEAATKTANPIQATNPEQEGSVASVVNQVTFRTNKTRQAGGIGNGTN